MQATRTEPKSPEVSSTVYVLRDSSGRSFGAYEFYTEAKLVGLRLFGVVRPFSVVQASVRA